MRPVGSSLLALLAVLFLIGCTTMSVTPLAERPLPQVEDWETVAIYDDSTEITEPYQEVAVLAVSSAPTKEKMINDCQRRAAAIGANGILIERAAKHGQSAWCRTGSVPVMVPHPAWHGRVLAILVTPQ